RNAVLRSMGYLIDTKHVLLIRLLVACSYLFVLFLEFRLTRRLGAGRLGALLGTSLLAFYPRNHEAMFWLSPWQELIVAICMLVVCICYLEYRQSRRSVTLAVAAGTALIGLGFKETMVVFPLLLLLIDVTQQRPLGKERSWRGYWPLLGVLVPYGV